uniref:UBA domain-containing protein n=1 Tax=Ditylum brightwellii TaxID=49249 RepID=A0A7S2ERS4_9STRA|mmetsp:Transcript_5222/g.7969  ORF Transcript_5222/g.7969 Transcript_5222/m.7969 type:complete len:421 (+) Transcript_5222:375-1637(+)
MTPTQPPQLPPKEIHRTSLRKHFPPHQPKMTLKQHCRETRRVMEMEDQRLAKQLQKDLDKEVQKHLRRKAPMSKKRKPAAKNAKNTQTKLPSRKKLKASLLKSHSLFLQESKEEEKGGGSLKKVKITVQKQAWNDSSDDSDSSSSLSSSPLYTKPASNHTNKLSPTNNTQITPTTTMSKPSNATNLLFQPSSDDDDGQLKSPPKSHYTPDTSSSIPTLSKPSRSLIRTREKKRRIPLATPLTTPTKEDDDVVVIASPVESETSSSSSSSQSSTSSSSLPSPPTKKQITSKQSKTEIITNSSLTQTSPKHSSTSSSTSSSSSKKASSNKRETRGKVNETILAQLLSMGFPILRAKQCLRDANNDAALAISMLLSASASTAVPDAAEGLVMAVAKGEEGINDEELQMVENGDGRRERSKRRR